MPRPIRVIDTGVRSGRENVAFDQALIEARSAGRSPETIRFLRFRPAALVGLHQMLSHEVRLEYCARHGIEVGRRITGGGGLYLDEGQLGWALALERRALGTDLASISARICAAAAVEAFFARHACELPGLSPLDFREVVESALRQISLYAAGHALRGHWRGAPPAQAPALVFLHDALGSVRLWRAALRPLGQRRLRAARAALRARLPAAGGARFAARGARADRRARRNPHRPVGRRVDRARLRRRVPRARARRDRPVAAPVRRGAHPGGDREPGQGLHRGRPEVAPAPAPRCEYGTAVRAPGRGLDRETGWKSWGQEPQVARVRCPVLAIQGEDDEFFTVAQLEALARLLPGRLDTLRIPGCGHYPLHQARNEVLAASIRLIRAVGVRNSNASTGPSS